MSFLFELVGWGFLAYAACQVINACATIVERENMRELMELHRDDDKEEGEY